MSRKPFLNLTRQGKLKRIKKTAQLQNEIEEQGSRHLYENNPATPFSYESDENSSQIFSSYEIEKEQQWEEINNSSSSDESDVVNLAVYSENEKLCESLRAWAIQFCIINVALSALLCILRTHKCFNLPLDARTLLKTQSTVPLQPVTPGSYCHLGLKTGLEKLLFPIIKSITTSVELLIGVDGLPLFNSNSG